MFINPIASQQLKSTQNKKRVASKTSFKPEGNMRSARAEIASAANAVTHIDGILALQDIEHDTDINERATAKGYDLLDQLDALKIALLQGKIPSPELEKLSDILATPIHGELSPQLDNVMQEIELRAKVELAKRARYS